MSKVAYPSMKKYGYSNSLASASIAAGGTLGILIPPSIILMIYGILTQTNIGQLFVAGVIPGLLGLTFYMLAIYVIAILRPAEAPRGKNSTAAERCMAILLAFYTDYWRHLRQNFHGNGSRRNGRRLCITCFYVSKAYEHSGF
jgi:TRAP-type C4-dicarboxylate transport system permease large subunit